jgi:hypothetical protein
LSFTTGAFGSRDNDRSSFIAAADDVHFYVPHHVDQTKASFYIPYSQRAFLVSALVSSS